MKALDYIGKKQIFLLVAVITSLSVIAIGIPQNTVSGTCYERKQVCHGLPLDGCIGESEYMRDVVPENECAQIENIESLCNAAGEEICRLNENAVGTGWAEQTKVKGLTCSRWDREYSLELMSC